MFVFRGGYKYIFDHPTSNQGPSESSGYIVLERFLHQCAPTTGLIRNVSHFPKVRCSKVFLAIDHPSFTQHDDRLCTLTSGPARKLNGIGTRKKTDTPPRSFQVGNLYLGRFPRIFRFSGCFANHQVKTPQNPRLATIASSACSRGTSDAHLNLRLEQRLEQLIIALGGAAV